MSTSSPSADQPPKDTFKIIIIGGGIAGLTFARSCLDNGFTNIHLFERRPLPAMLSGPGGIFIQRNAMRVYELLNEGNIASQLYKKGGKIINGGFISNRGEKLYMNSPSFAGEDDLGVCILRPELQRVLYESVKDGIEIKCGWECVGSVENEVEGKVRVLFENGEEVVGDVLVAADGLYSEVRGKLEARERWEGVVYSGMTCWTGYFRCGDEVELDSGLSWVEMWGKGDRFGYFDVGEGRYAFYTFCNTAPNGDDDAKGGAMRIMKELLEGYVEPVPSILKAIESQKSEICRRDVYDRLPPAKKWGRSRITMIGDAAHPVLPNIGQGGCQAIEDSFELAKVLGKVVGNKDKTAKNLENELRKFEASRTDRVTKVFHSSRQVGQLGQTSSAIGVFLRNWMYKLMPKWLADAQFRWIYDYHPTWEGSETGSL